MELEISKHLLTVSGTLPMKTKLPSPSGSPIAAARLAAIAIAAVPSPAPAAAGSASVRVEATVPAGPADVWRVWTTSSGAEEFFAPKAHVGLHLGGPFEIFFDPADRTKSSRSTVLSYAPGEMISFGWQLPPMFAEMRVTTTWVVVTIQPDANGQSIVVIQQLGLGTGPAWEQVRLHMERGWNDLLARLQQRFSRGPIDWAAEVAAASDKNEFSLRARPIVRP